MNNATLNEWQNDGIKLTKRYAFPDFVSALAFVNKLGNYAEKMQHHPDIELGWGYCVVSWSTHDAGAVTDKDIEMSKESDTMFESENNA
ncbi:MAG: Pterin-4a-carbinolamine dehydratase [Candidatus Kaiserbacteria bacterium]|nr:Pterin-4a-carbinolamine dehydratase [Candidatus Kaiserbacteria bacterium]